MDTIRTAKEHQWLGRLVGDWAWSHEAPVTDETRVTHIEGTEHVRAIGPLWVQGESVGPIPEGGVAVSQMTLTWDTGKNRFAGTWLGSTSSFIWMYDGELAPDGQALSLYAEGPAMDGSGRLVAYRDVIRFIDDNTRTLTAAHREAGGPWVEFMTMTSRRR